MPPKKDPYAGASQKVVGLFGLLLFSGRAHSLAQLAAAFQCSKQTVLRMVEEIERSGWLTLDTWTDERRRKWYAAQTPRKLPNVTLNAEALGQLMLCRDMVWHMLPDGYRTRTSRALQGSTVLLPEFDDRVEALGSYVQTKPKGMIDYTGKEQMISTAIQAIRERRLCKITYRGPKHRRATTYTVAPYQLVIFHEGLYIRCRPKAAIDDPGSQPDKTLAVHRMSKVVLTTEVFEELTSDTNQSQVGPFGLTTGEAFRVKVRIVPKAAMYVRERVWSDDQTIEDLEDGSILLTFTSTSELETLSWVLSFGGEAELLEPEGLRRRAFERARLMVEGHTATIEEGTR